MVEFSKVNVKLSNTHIKKIKYAVKDNTETTLRISLKMLRGNNNCHMNYYWQQDKKTKLRNAFNNNMSANIKILKKNS